MTDPLEGTPATRPADKPARRSDARVAGAAIVGAIAAVFAVINLDDVEVNWLVGSWQTPLILVIVISMLLGAGLDRLLVRRARKRKHERRRERS
jgi:putative membrane protein